MTRALKTALAVVAACLLALAASVEGGERSEMAEGPTNELLRSAPGTHRALQQELFDAQNPADPKAAAVDAEKNTGAASRAVHRVYDPVTGLYCELVGDCHSCPVTEKEETYCRETGHRQELNCPKASTTGGQADPNAAREIRFQACTPIQKAHPFLRVITFEIMMAGILAGSFVLLRKERRKNMSAFDLRKDPRQRTTLLGSHADKNAD